MIGWSLTVRPGTRARSPGECTLSLNDGSNKCGRAGSNRGRWHCRGRGVGGRERERGRGRELWRGEGEGKGASFLGRRPAGRREERRDVSLKLHPPNMSGPLDAGHPKLLASIQNRGQGPSHLHQLHPTPLCPTVAAVLSPRNESSTHIFVRLFGTEQRCYNAFLCRLPFTVSHPSLHLTSKNQSWSHDSCPLKNEMQQEILSQRNKSIQS